MNEEEIIKYAKIFSNAKGDTYKINFVNENKTIDEVEIWKEILKLIDKKDKVIDLMVEKIDRFGMFKVKCKSNTYKSDDLYTAPMSREEIKEYFYKKVEEEND